MTDTIKLAKERMAFLQVDIDSLHDEIGRLKDYIRASEKLLGDGWLGPPRRKGPVAEAAPRPLQTPAGQATAEAVQRNDLARPPAAMPAAAPVAASANGKDGDDKNLFRRWKT